MQVNDANSLDKFDDAHKNNNIIKKKTLTESKIEDLHPADKLGNAELQINSRKPSMLKQYAVDPIKSLIKGKSLQKDVEKLEKSLEKSKRTGDYTETLDRAKNLMVGAAIPKKEESIYITNQKISDCEKILNLVGQIPQQSNAVLFKVANNYATTLALRTGELIFFDDYRMMNTYRQAIEGSDSNKIRTSGEKFEDKLGRRLSELTNSDVKLVYLNNFLLPPIELSPRQKDIVIGAMNKVLDEIALDSIIIKTEDKKIDSAIHFQLEKMIELKLKPSQLIHFAEFHKAQHVLNDFPKNIFVER